MTGLDPLFAPDGVAVIGASRHGGKLGAAMARSLSGFPGRVLVNSRNPEPDAGIFASVAESGDVPPDLAVLCVPASACAGALAEAAAAGCRAALVCAGGFGEIGLAGAEPERALRRVVEDTGIRLLGPNTSGFVVPHLGLTASFVPGAARLPAGEIAVVAASGGVNHALSFALANEGYGVRLAVGIGAGMDVTTADVLDHLAGDPGTTAVALHLETVPDGPRLIAALRRLCAAKPVAALVVGRTDVGDFARSHTGALATAWRTTRAAVRQAGAVLADDERELVDAVTALSMARPAPSADPGLGVVTAQAGPGLLLADRVDIRLPELTAETQAALGNLLPPMTFQRNPVDTGRPGEDFSTVLREVAGDPGVDLLAVYALAEPDTVDLVAAVQDSGVTGPAVVAIGGPHEQVAEQRAQLHKLGVPTVAGPAAAANAVRALAADARQRAVRAERQEQGVRLPGGPLDEHEAKWYLEKLGVRTPDRRACSSRDEAHQALAELGGPVAVKLLDATVSHKTEVGGVHLGVRTPSELDSALDAIGAARVLVEAMAPGGVDLVVGARRDPVFGPVVLAGLGGTAAEALADVAVRLAPLGPAEAATMVDELAGKALLRGWRGGPVLGTEEFGRVVSAIGATLVASPGVAELEVNPLRLTENGLIALDAVVVGNGRDGHA